MKNQARVSVASLRYSLRLRPFESTAILVDVRGSIFQILKLKTSIGFLRHGTVQCSSSITFDIDPFGTALLLPQSGCWETRTSAAEYTRYIESGGPIHCRNYKSTADFSTRAREVHEIRASVQPSAP